MKEEWEDKGGGKKALTVLSRLGTKSREGGKKFSNYERKKTIWSPDREF